MRLTIAALLAVAAALVVSGLTLVPVSHAFSFVVSPGPGSAWVPVNRSFPQGAQVTVYWADSIGKGSRLQITEGAGAVLYDQVATGGTFSFTASGGVYGFQGCCGTMNVWGHWDAPTI